MDRIVQFILEKRALALALIISFVVAVGMLAFYVTMGRFATDFGLYWRIANEPPSMAYLPDSDLPFPYLPTMMLWIEPLSLVSLWPAYLAWVICSAVVLGLTCRRYLTKQATALALLSPPLVGCYLTGQVSAALTAVLLWACGAPNRIVAGIALAVIASIKPQFVIMAPLMLCFQRDWRAIFSSATAFGLIFVASIIAFGVDTWFVWASSLDEFHGMVVDEQVMSVGVTPAGAAEYWGLAPIPFLILGAILGAWLVYRCRSRPPLITAAAIGCGSLLAAPYALIHDLAVVVPFLAWSVFQGRITAALAISGAVHPVPLILTTANLARASGRESVSSPFDPANRLETPSIG